MDMERTENSRVILICPPPLKQNKNAAASAASSGMNVGELESRRGFKDLYVSFPKRTNDFRRSLALLRPIP